MRLATAQADIEATAARVWDALTSPAPAERYLAGLSITSAWQPDARVDACHDGALIATGSVVIADKPADLTYRLDEPGTGDIDCWPSWHLEQAESGVTRVTLTATTLPGDPPVDTIRLLSNLKTYLETGPQPPPSPPAGRPARGQPSGK